MTDDEPASTEEPFRLEEATIDGLHRAIRSGRTTWTQVVAPERIARWRSSMVASSSRNGSSREAPASSWARISV